MMREQKKEVVQTQTGLKSFDYDEVSRCLGNTVASDVLLIITANYKNKEFTIEDIENKLNITRTSVKKYLRDIAGVIGLDAKLKLNKNDNFLGVIIAYCKAQELNPDIFKTALISFSVSCLEEKYTELIE